MRSACIPLLLICVPVWAADWIPLQINNGDQYFYDNSKLVIKDDEITYWKKVLFKTPQMHKGSEVSSGVLRERIHCGEHTAKLLSYLYYAPSGETVEYSTQEESAPMPIVPDTVGDAYDRVLCPIVWRKQEENRIRNESKALDSDTVPAKEDDKTAAPAKPPLKDNRATPTVKTPKPPTPPKSTDVKLPPNVHLPDKNAPVSIPEPQILQNLDNLY